MTTAYSPLLGLALPVTGELSGTWGDTVNDYITKYVDAAVAGTQTISGTQTAVTLSTANGATLTQAGSGATGSAQYAVINCTGNPVSLLTITAPASSKSYIIINATSTSQSVKIVGVGPTTGVTVASGEKAVVAWNGSDFVKVASSILGVTSVTASAPLASSGGTTPDISFTGTLAVGNGGTGQTTYTNGQLLIGNTTGNTLTKATLTQGTGITVTNGTGSITIANSGVTSNVAGTGISVSGATGAVTITNSGVTSLAGTANQITASAATGSITLSTPQSINTTASVQFGSFGVGTAASGTTGEIRATNNITAYYSSDRKLKENIRDIPNAVDSVKAVGGKLFDWTDDYIKQRGGEDGYFVCKQDFGVIAQDVQAVLPQAVRTREDGTLAVDYEKLCALAFAAIKELAARVEALEAQK